MEGTCSECEDSGWKLFRESTPVAHELTDSAAITNGEVYCSPVTRESSLNGRASPAVSVHDGSTWTSGDLPPAASSPGRQMLGDAALGQSASLTVG
jgi:hypothetical protein